MSSFGNRDGEEPTAQRSGSIHPVRTALRRHRTFVALSAGAFVARLAGMSFTLLLVVQISGPLALGIGAAGVAIAVACAGTAVGSPQLGRLTDRCGLRPVVLLACAVDGLFWIALPALPYPALLVCVGLRCVLSIPTSVVVNRAIPSISTPEERIRLYGIDSSLSEVAFIAGPAAMLAVAGVFGVPAAALVSALAAIVGNLILLVADGRSVDRRPQVSQPRWVGIVAGIAGQLSTAICVAGVLIAVEIVVAASASHLGQPLGAIAFTTWGIASMAGGLLVGSSWCAGLSSRALCLLACISALLVAWSVNSAAIIATVVPFGVLVAMGLAVLTRDVSIALSAGSQGAGMGCLKAAITIGGSLGALLFAGVSAAAEAHTALVALAIGCATVVALARPDGRGIAAPAAYDPLLDTHHETRERPE